MSNNLQNNQSKSATYALNTSNPNKLKEFKRLFTAHGIQLEVSEKDIKEIIADPITVVTHKASQLPPYTIIEDTSLEVEGAEVGIHVKWLLDNLSDFLGRKATWKVLLAYRKNDNQVYIYQGKINGVLVTARGKGFGFDPVFQPEGTHQTLAESKPDQYSARAQAVLHFVQQKPITIKDAITEWDGPWQQD